MTTKIDQIRSLSLNNVYIYRLFCHLDDFFNFRNTNQAQIR